MGLQLDHLAICAETLGDGVAYVEDLLQVTLSAGGEHPHMGTYNRLLSLGPEIYLEVIAINPQAPAPAHARWFNLDSFTGTPKLTNWIARCVDLSAATARAPAGIGEIVELERGNLKWRMAVPKDGRLPYDGAHPALISWQGSKHPAAGLPDFGCRLQRLEIFHPDAKELRQLVKLEPDPSIVHFSQAPEMKITAIIDTPSGPVSLG